MASRIPPTASGGAQVATPAVSVGRLSDSGPHYSVNAAYPVLAHPALSAINAQARGFLQSLVAAFLEERTADAQDLGGDFEPPPWSLEIDYDIPYLTDRFVVIDFGGYDFRGGAHGMPIIEPLVLTRPAATGP